MKHYILFVFSLFVMCASVFAQKDKTSLVSSKAKKITVEGQLIGRYDKPPPEVVEVFLYLEKLRGEATWDLGDETFNITCAPKRSVDSGINIEMGFNEEATAHIRKTLQQNPNEEISLHYNLYIGNSLSKYEGYCHFKLKDSKNDKADPQTTFTLKNGFVVSDPEELSIFLISSHINTALDSSFDKERRITISANWNPLLGIRELKELPDSLTGQSNNFTQLGKTMSLYNFCNFYLDRSSFFSREADTLLTRIQRLRTSIEFLQKDAPNLKYMDSLNRKLNEKLDSYQLYKLTELKLIETKQKIEAILRRSYLNFRK